MSKANQKLTSTFDFSEREINYILDELLVQPRLVESPHKQPVDNDFGYNSDYDDEDEDAHYIEWKTSTLHDFEEELLAWEMLHPVLWHTKNALTSTNFVTEHDIRSLCQFSADAELNVNGYRYADVSLRWRSIHNVACVLIAMCVINYVCSSFDETSKCEGLEKEYGINDAIHYLDFALIKTAGSPCVKAIHKLHGLISAFLDRNVPQSHVSSDLVFPVKELNRPILTHPGARIGCPSIAEFWNDIYKDEKPCILENTIDHWPAFDVGRSWNSVPYLLSRTSQGRRIVPVEIGSSYVDPDMQHRIMAFEEYLSRYVNQASNEIGYLAQHDLLTQIPALRNDIAIADYLYTRQIDPVINTWLGPAGTVTPLHFDKYWNLLCQVVGKKYVRLYSPDQSHLLYPRGLDELGVDMFNTSFVDIEGENKEYPLFEKAEYVEFILEPGDCLLIPRRWWHYVRSISVSISINFWWESEP